MKKRQILCGVLALIMAVFSVGCNITGVPQNYCTANITDPISNKQFSINIDANGLLNDGSNIIGIRTDKDINALCENINNCNSNLNATVVNGNAILLYDDAVYYIIRETENIDFDYTPENKDEKLYALCSEVTSFSVFENDLPDYLFGLYYDKYTNDNNDRPTIYYPYHLFDTKFTFFDEHISADYTEPLGTGKSNKEIFEKIYDYYYSIVIYDTSYEDIFGSETLYCIKVHQTLYSDDDFTFYIYYDSASEEGFKYSLIPPETYIQIQQSEKAKEDALYESKGHVGEDAVVSDNRSSDSKHTAGNSTNE